MDATVQPLGNAEREWLSNQLAAAERFVADYGSQRHAGQGGLDALDHAWASWLDRQMVDPEDPDAVINAVGVAFGQALVDGLDGFAWVRVDDGADLAVYGLPGAGDVLVYPANVVARRYEDSANRFLRPAYDAIVAEIEQLRG